METCFHKLSETCGYFLYELNNEGYCENDALTHIEAAIQTNNYTDIILFAHGWNVNYNEDGSVIFANDLIPLIEERVDEEMKVLYICVKWPSLVQEGVNLGHAYITEESESESRHNSIMEVLRQDRSIESPKNFKMEDLDAVENYMMLDTIKTYGKKFMLASLFGVVGQAAMLSYSAQDAVFRFLTRRAYTVGSRGMHMLIGYIMKITSVESKIHLYGFSMGATVVLAAAIGTAPGSVFRRKIHSIHVFQGAVNNKWLRKKNIFRPLCCELKPVAGPIVFTHAENDLALIGLNVANSAFRMKNKERAVGYKGVDDQIEPMQLEEISVHEFNDESFILEEGICYNVNCKTLEGFHHHANHFPEVVEAFLKTIRADVKKESYKFVEHGELPDGYWTDIKVRTS